MHRDSGLTVRAIARHFGVQEPCIYRAFRLEQYFTPNMLERRHERSIGRLPPNPKGGASALAKGVYIPREENLPPRVYRDPCPRCGVRGDIGCGHSKGALGWCAG
jgi:hypothetical protein